MTDYLHLSERYARRRRAAAELLRTLAAGGLVVVLLVLMVLGALSCVDRSAGLANEASRVRPASKHEVDFLTSRVNPRINELSHQAVVAGR